MFISPNLPLEIPDETIADKNDLEVFLNDSWLMDTEVQYLIMEKKSRWYLTMVFIWLKNPFRIFCRQIDSYHSEHKAKTYASILQRAIRKDARGTLKLNRDDFNICHN